MTTASKPEEETWKLQPGPSGKVDAGSGCLQAVPAHHAVGPWMPRKLPCGGSRQTQEMSFLRGHQGETIEESELYLPSLLWAGWRGSSKEPFVLRKKGILGQAHLKNTSFFLGCSEHFRNQRLVPRQAARRNSALVCVARENSGVGGGRRGD